MREAPVLAGLPDRRPRSPGPRRSKSPERKPRWRASLMGRAFAKPGVTIAGAAFAALMAGIVGNAILFQKGHRPTPLFGAGQAVASEPLRSVPIPPRNAAADLAPVPTAPPTAPVVATPAALPPAGPPSPAPAVASASHGPKAVPGHPILAKAAAPKGHVDAIGGLIGRLDGRSTTSPSVVLAATKAVARKPLPGVARLPETHQN